MKKKNHIVFLVICSVIVAQVCLAQDLSIGKEEISPDNLPGDEIPDWVARWELARVLSYIKRYDESLIEYQKVLSEKPESFKARAEMAAIIYYSGDKGKALLEFEKLNTEKLSSDSRIVLADIYMTMKQYDKAESIYREHLSKQPNDYKVHRKLAKILSWDKRYKESLAEYEIIINVLPDDIQIRREYAFVLSWSGNHTKAAEELRKTLK